MYLPLGEFNHQSYANLVTNDIVKYCKRFKIIVRLPRTFIKSYDGTSTKKHIFKFNGSSFSIDNNISIKNKIGSFSIACETDLDCETLQQLLTYEKDQATWFVVGYGDFDFASNRLYYKLFITNEMWEQISKYKNAIDHYRSINVKPNFGIGIEKVTYSDAQKYIFNFINKSIELTKSDLKKW